MDDKGRCEPGESSLDNPSARQELKASDPGGARDDLDLSRCQIWPEPSSLAQVGPL
jgi:hypothetical protein